jgi:hypothetical protein
MSLHEGEYVALSHGTGPIPSASLSVSNAGILDILGHQLSSTVKNRQVRTAKNMRRVGTPEKQNSAAYDFSAASFFFFFHFDNHADVPLLERLAIEQNATATVTNRISPGCAEAAVSQVDLFKQGSRQMITSAWSVALAKEAGSTSSCC